MPDQASPAPLPVHETVITSHANADFDALASMIAASKLYPGAALIFPGSQERNIRDFFIQTATYLFAFRKLADIDERAVRRLVVTDTRQRSRLPHVAPLLDRPDVRRIAFDHHPDTGEDIAADESTVLPWGSTTAIIVDLLMKADTPVTGDEATFMGLGLYEDTGSFTFPSTTSHDLAAAAWLRERGMDLEVVKDLLTRELSLDQVGIMGQLLESAKTMDVAGVKVMIAESTSDEYVDDFALLAHKLMDIRSVSALFALGLMQDRVHVVARSRTHLVDVGRICATLGGGGHPFAASATIKGQSLTQVRDALLGLLATQVNPKKLVEEHLSRPAVFVEEDAPLSEALSTMVRYGFKAMPVVARDSHTPVGVIERDIADKAKVHGLGDMAVSEYMRRNVPVVGAGDELYSVMELILNQRLHLVPVVEQGGIIGVITRTDVVGAMMDEPSRIPEALTNRAGTKGRNVAGLLRELMPQATVQFLKMAGELGARMDATVYAVGGFVRDLLMRRPNYDLDLVIEGGEAPGFAKILAEKLGGRAKVHEKFKTAVVVMPGGEHIDVATARLEYYTHPAALPTVELSSLKLDLYRRDFSINALAINLSPAHYGEVADFFGARQDIKDKLIRVLHSLSFVEDPTRIIRAVRFEQRFEFRMSGETMRLVKNALSLGLIGKLSGARVLGELEQIFAELFPVRALRRLDELKVLTAIHPSLVLTPSRLKVLEAVERVVDWLRLSFPPPLPDVGLIYLLALCSGLKPEEAAGICERLALVDKRAQFIANTRQQVWHARDQLRLWLGGEHPPSELYALLSPLPMEGLAFLMAKLEGDDNRRHVAQFAMKLRNMRPDVTGADILAMGVPPGPRVSELLRVALRAKLDGEASCRADQLSLIQSLIGPMDSQGGKQAM